MRFREDKEVTKIACNWIVKNLLLGAAFVIVLLTVVNFILKFGTKHGKETEVPDFSGMTYEEARASAACAGLNVTVTDSVYMRRLRKGAVYNQSPKPGEMVKEGRTIELTTNSRTPKKVPMPSLVGLSMMQAKTELESRGFILGRLIYVDDIATNIVIGQKLGNKEIRPGTMVKGSSTINLVVGLSSSDANTYIPNLVGRKYQRAVKMIHDNSLNVGKVVFDKTVKTYSDTLNAVVLKQSPEPDGSTRVRGSEISIKLGVNREQAAR